jgi:hypothetical protein
MLASGILAGSRALPSARFSIANAIGPLQSCGVCQQPVKREPARKNLGRSGAHGGRDPGGEQHAKNTRRSIRSKKSKASRDGDLEEHLRRNYANDVVLLTANSNLVGHDAIRLSTSA